MSAEEIYNLWFIWLIIGSVIVIAAAALLITIIALAHRIATLAKTAVDVVGEIEQNTKPIWQLSATNQVASDLLGGAEAIRDNVNAIADALTEADKNQAA